MQMLRKHKNNQVFHGVVTKKKKKLVQFDVYFFMVSKGKPMIDYENMNKLLQFLDVKDFPKTHWYNLVGWEMVSYMHEIMVKKTRGFIQVAKSISLSCDEVIILDQQSWVSIHAYVVENWQQTPLLLSLQQVVDGATSNNLKRIFVDAMVLYGDLIEKTMASKLITFGVDGVSVFQGVKTWVTMQLKDQNVQIMIRSTLHEPPHKFDNANSFKVGHCGEN